MYHPFFSNVDLEKLYKRDVFVPIRPKVKSGSEAATCPNSFRDRNSWTRSRCFYRQDSDSGTLQKKSEQGLVDGGLRFEMLAYILEIRAS